MTKWLGFFTETITCPYCQSHFHEMHKRYREKFPGYLDSRQAFAMFAFRCHNVVNARLSKPVYSTLEECLNVLRNATKTRSAQDYRISYINHIMRYWSGIQDTHGITALKKAFEMKKIEIDYVGLRDTKFDVQLRDDGVVIPRQWVEHVPGGHVTETQAPRLMPRANDSLRAGFRIQGGRMRLF